MMRKKNSCSRLRHRLMLQQEIRDADGVGGYLKSWKDMADVWAEIIPVSGREKLTASQLQSEVSHRIIIRYRDDVTAGQRVVFETRAFNIRAVMNRREDNESLELLAEEGTAN